MSQNSQTKSSSSFWQRHKLFRTFIIMFVVAIVLLVAWLIFASIRADRYQAQLQPFYDTQGLSTQGQAGEVVKQEPLGIPIDGGSGVRVLYRTQKADGSFTFSSGMVFIPSQPTTSPRPVVAWAHGTIGMGDRCAPTRLSDPIANLDWISSMLKLGWVVTATDYAGLGTEGTEQYLVGASEAHDVLNSVRAARQIPGSQAGNQFAVWGHSQGGHSALFTSQFASSYSPELQLVSTVASAPAAELTALLNEQYGTAIDWVIGPEILISWPDVYKNLDINTITTPQGLKSYQNIANKCISQAALIGMVRNDLDQHIFSQNPIDVPAWAEVAKLQTAPVLSPSQPVMVVESLSDTVVLPNTTALYIQKACQSGSNLASLWINDVGHLKIPQVTSPQVISWMNDRFSGKPNNSTCSQPLPIAPANN